MCCCDVQVLDAGTGKLKKDLAYQAEDQFMMHDMAVLCLAFSRDGEVLVSGKHGGRGLEGGGGAGQWQADPGGGGMIGGIERGG